MKPPITTEFLRETAPRVARIGDPVEPRPPWTTGLSEAENAELGREDIRAGRCRSSADAQRWLDDLVAGDRDERLGKNT